MNNQKLDNSLNLALSVDEDVRNKSLDLAVGYEGDKVWELIIRYTGNLNRLLDLDIEVIELLLSYAIIRVREELINEISKFDEIIFIEKPKRLNFEVVNSIRSSCITSIQSGLKLYGEGCIVGVIDSGIDYANNVFLDINGATRIVYIWDESDNSGNPPAGYMRGSEYNSTQINEAIRGEGVIGTRDISGHGTAVASVAVGNFALNKADNIGIATKSEIVAVKLGNPDSNGFPRTSELMMGVDYCIRKSLELDKPIAINISFGNNYGSHDGSSLLEQYINSVASVGRTTIVIGTGNEGTSAGHFRTKLEDDKDTEIEISVGRFQTSFNVQLWKNYADVIEIEIVSPSGVRTGKIGGQLSKEVYNIEEGVLLVYYGEPSPFSTAQEIYFEFIPKQDYLQEGVYVIRIISLDIKIGEIDLWLPIESSLNNAKFLLPDPYVTLTSPSTALNVISVGAYDAFFNSYAEFSGRGFLRENNLVKPDIVAPGVNIVAATSYGVDTFSGTSFATPVVSGSAALMMEWGIIRMNDPFLYGEKVKAYMIKGAKRLPGEDVPSRRTGWGALCVADSIPK